MSKVCTAKPEALEMTLAQMRECAWSVNSEETPEAREVQMRERAQSKEIPECESVHTQ